MLAGTLWDTARMSRRERHRTEPQQTLGINHKASWHFYRVGQENMDTYLPAAVQTPGFPRAAWLSYCLGHDQLEILFRRNYKALTRTRRCRRLVPRCLTAWTLPGLHIVIRHDCSLRPLSPQWPDGWFFEVLLSFDAEVAPG